MIRKVGRFLDKSIEKLGNMAALMAVGILIIMVLMITANVFLRYLFRIPLHFSVEYSGYMLAFIVYIGYAYVTRQEAHISVEVIHQRLKKRIRDGLDVITTLIALALVGVYFKYGWDFCIGSLLTGQLSETVMLTPLWIPRAVLPVGLILFSLALGVYIVQKFIGFKRGK